MTYSIEQQICCHNTKSGTLHGLLAHDKNCFFPRGYTDARCQMLVLVGYRKLPRKARQHSQWVASQVSLIERSVVGKCCLILDLGLVCPWQSQVPSRYRRLLGVFGDTRSKAAATQNQDTRMAHRGKQAFNTRQGPRGNVLVVQPNMK